MKSFKVSILCFTAILIFGQPVWAVGASSYDWTGLYIGAHVGYGFAQGNSTDTPLFNGETGHDTVTPSTLHPNPDGVIGGGQIGYNLQRGCFVFGIETDLSSIMNGTDSVSPIVLNGFPVPGSQIMSHETISWFGTFRPRLGYTVTPCLLLYGTGGLAYGHVNYLATEAYPGILYTGSVSTTKTGWTVGAGVEYAIGKRWSVKAEYLFMDLGKETVLADPSPPNPPFQSRFEWDTAFHIVNLGVNIKF